MGKEVAHRPKAEETSENWAKWGNSSNTWSRDLDDDNDDDDDDDDDDVFDENDDDGKGGGKFLCQVSLSQVLAQIWQLGHL